ncbi:hypothetical protein [Natrialba aegyptia]|uniref:DUF7982 domain-containing protein n=1 Tax=Natrialba aegyptia DSM 13077 TaxID=1227491 RepID=M0AGS1_9EURY|nr:hypothetical protein [Natrialba aegyptia]ELY97764.1 hypothetical protein C480_21724 [Natrialba aegyptia DSM 13077]
MSTKTTPQTDRSDSQPTERTTSEDPSASNRADANDTVEVELLAEENRRLRAEYARTRRTTYRRTAFWIAAIGVVAVGGGLWLPDARQVLFALGATGLFGGVLTYYLTPSRFIPADIGERVYATGATNLLALADELGLREEYHYLPSSDSRPPRLFVPQRTDSDIPDDRSGPIVTHAAERGLLLEPTGSGLFTEFERALNGSLPTAATQLATELGDGVAEQLALTDRVETSVDPDDGRATVTIESSAFGDVDRFDHPIASFFAIGFAEGLDRPVELEIDPGEKSTEWLLTYRWETH